MDDASRNDQRLRGVASTTLSALVEMARRRGALKIGETLDDMGRTGFGVVMLLLALPALIPIPGPFGLVFGSALAIVALQFVLGRRSIWLPALLRNRTISAAAFESLERYAAPIVRRIERTVCPDRMAILTGRLLPYFLGLPVFALAVAIALPIPFGNLMPVLAILVMAIGLIERDGLVVLFGLVLTTVALATTAALFHGAVYLIAAAQ